MKNIQYKKLSEAGKLTIELRQAGFKVIGVTCDGTITTVHLDDSETKDPTPIVEKHVYEVPIIVKPIDQQKLKEVLLKASIIKSYNEIEVQ
jgi:hypothetical protein